MFKTLITATLVLLLIHTAGCSDDKNHINDEAGINAFCEASKNMQSETVVCIDFYSGDLAQSSCPSEELNYTSSGADGNYWIDSTGTTPIITCRTQHGSTLTNTGNCRLTDRIIRYYTNFWSATSARANCTSRSGVFF